MTTEHHEGAQLPHAGSDERRRQGTRLTEALQRLPRHAIREKDVA